LLSVYPRVIQSATDAIRLELPQDEEVLNDQPDRTPVRTHIIGYIAGGAIRRLGKIIGTFTDSSASKDLLHCFTIPREEYVKLKAQVESTPSDAGRDQSTQPDAGAEICPLDAKVVSYNATTEQR